LTISAQFLSQNDNKVAGITVSHLFHWLYYLWSTRLRSVRTRTLFFCKVVIIETRRYNDVIGNMTI